MSPQALQLDSPLDQLIDSASVSRLRSIVPVSTVADLVGLMPVGYREPIDRVAIADLRAGCEAVVKGEIVSLEGRPATRTSRTEPLMSPVVVVADGTASLKVGFIEAPVGQDLLPGRHVVVRGCARGIEIPLLVPEVVAFEMDDALISLLETSEIARPTPLFDAPAAIYTPNDTTSRCVSRCIAIALRAVLPLPSMIHITDAEVFSGETLAAVLRAIHRPDTIAEHDWGWDQRHWAISVLTGLDGAARVPAAPPEAAIRRVGC